MEEWVCSICLNNDKTNTVKLEPCNHEFHGNCIVTNLRINGPKCPNCRGLDGRCKINFDYEENNYEEENFDNGLVESDDNYDNESNYELNEDDNNIFNIPDVDFELQELLLNISNPCLLDKNIIDKPVNEINEKNSNEII